MYIFFCKNCKKEFSAKRSTALYCSTKCWRSDNKDKLKTASKKYKEKNREKVLEKLKTAWHKIYKNTSKTKLKKYI
jgi:hypothetical protein